MWITHLRCTVINSLQLIVYLLFLKQALEVKNQILYAANFHSFFTCYIRDIYHRKRAENRLLDCF